MQTLDSPSMITYKCGYCSGLIVMIWSWNSLFYANLIRPNDFHDFPEYFVLEVMHWGRICKSCMRCHVIGSCSFVLKLLFFEHCNELLILFVFKDFLSSVNLLALFFLSASNVRRPRKTLLIHCGIGYLGNRFLAPYNCNYYKIVWTNFCDVLKA